jgi:tight adherence protein B
VQGEVRVQTAQGRLTGWILSFLPLGLLGLISVFSPGYCSILFTDPTGRLLLYGGGGCIVLGALVIRQIVKVSF